MPPTASTCCSTTPASAGAGAWSRQPRRVGPTFAVCWGGVYHGTRAFLPLLLAADEGHVVNTSSVNGFWACLGPNIAHTAYSAAKFAVKGFTEALIIDFRLNAPHLHASVVMPGHVGTSIAINSNLRHGRDPKDLTAEQVTAPAAAAARCRRTSPTRTSARACPAGAEEFRDKAPLTAAGAAAIILDGVRNDEWRILVGDDAPARQCGGSRSPRGGLRAGAFSHSKASRTAGFLGGGLDRRE